jgi:hypothetical protein
MLKRLCCFGERGDGVVVEREVVTGGLVGNEYFVVACAPWRSARTELYRAQASPDSSGLCATMYA